ncbi:hypothetical protein J6590_104649 [Homalodisca vitripennis]|nr:hypothetical protein J6590_104649 [Homalodisca vitripennis]
MAAAELESFSVVRKPYFALSRCTSLTLISRTAQNQHDQPGSCSVSGGAGRADHYDYGFEVGDHNFGGNEQHHHEHVKIITLTKKVPPYPVKVQIDKPYPVHVPKPYPVDVEKKVPLTVKKHMPYPVKVPVDKPYPVHVPVVKHVPYTIEKKVPYKLEVPVEKPVPVPVPKPYPVYVEKKVPYTVEKPVPYHVKVPVHVPVHHHELSYNIFQTIVPSLFD